MRVFYASRKPGKMTLTVTRGKDSRHLDSSNPSTKPRCDANCDEMKDTMSDNRSKDFPGSNNRTQHHSQFCSGGDSVEGCCSLPFLSPRYQRSQNTFIRKKSRETYHPSFHYGLWTIQRDCYCYKLGDKNSQRNSPRNCTRPEHCPSGIEKAQTWMYWHVLEIRSNGSNHTNV